MQHNDWHSVFQTLKQRGVDTLTDQERKLRRLPIQKIKTVEAVFQPRQAAFSTAASAKHHAELKRALQAKGELDPIVVMKVGGAWYCLDGHHRLKAYQQAGGRRTHVPVNVFEGSLEDAFRFTVESNAPDKLNLSTEDKKEAAWRMLLLGLPFRQINHATTVSKGTIHNMDQARQRVREQWPSAAVESWTWENVKRLLNTRAAEGAGDGWKAVKAKEWAQALARHFKGLPSQHPQIFADAFLRYDPAGARAVAAEIQRRAVTEECEADF
ncbi:MAG: hypothetical protein A4E20_03800 [Nitrospira sp. SG-bin2]|nr:MAG: hypothetical protein A4E20_03800 [Nitrospira sp. SG-bin2]